MGFKVPANWDWFFPYLKETFSGEGLTPEDLFIHSTTDLLKIYPNQKLLPLLLMERFLLERVEGNIFKKEILSLVLEREKVKGYLLKLSKEFNPKLLEFSLINIEENLFFYPLSWGGFNKLLFLLWKQEIPFLAVEIELGSLNDYHRFLEPPQRLDFSRFTLQTQERLKDYLPFEDLSLVEEIEEKFLAEGDFLLLADKKGPIPEDLFKDIKILIIKESPQEFLLVGKGDVNKLLERVEALFRKVGILSKEIWRVYQVEGASPLMYALSALEHARRLKTEQKVFFEGFTYHVLGDLYYEWEDLGKALKYYDLAEGFTKQPIELALSKGAIYYLLGEFDQAEEILKSHLCGCEKEDPALHYNLGLIYYQKEAYEKSRYHFYKAHLLEPKNTLFREALIKFLWDTGAYQELEEVFSGIDDLTPKEQLYLGKLYFYQKKYEQAFELLKRTLNLPERDGETLGFLAWLYVYFNKEKEVCDLLKEEAKKLLTEKEKKKLIEEFGIEFR